MKQRVLLVFCGLVLGGLIVMASLASAVTASSLGTLHQEIQSEETPFFATLPGKVEAVRDRVALSTQNKMSRLNAKMVIAEKRLHAATEAETDGRMAYALESLTKGQQYIAEVVLAVEKEPEDCSELKVTAFDTLTQYQSFMLQLHAEADDTHRKIIDHLVSENKALIVHLGM